MTAESALVNSTDVTLSTPTRFVTAASLFDGHDASINIMRRIMQAEGAEVIHLGHDRSVEEVVNAAIEEDAHGIAISSYQGGHVEYFSWMMNLLEERGRPDIAVFGGGGGTITDREIEVLEERGVQRIYSVEDGRKLGLVGMIQDMLRRARDLRTEPATPEIDALKDRAHLARTLTWIENQWGASSGDVEKLEQDLSALRKAVDGVPDGSVPVLGITGTGGAGKSSLTDELLRRFLAAFPDTRIGVLSVDPSRRRTGGALLGDRIRMNSAAHERVFMRSMATRAAHQSVSGAVRDSLNAMMLWGAELLILETAGIGQSGSEVVDLSDISLYVMTPEFGAPSQLEKIDMLDFADIVAINKADKRGAEDARRYVCKQVQRNRGAFNVDPDTMPVFSCSASRFGDAGVNDLFEEITRQLETATQGRLGERKVEFEAPDLQIGLPGARVRYLAEVAESVRSYKAEAEERAELAGQAWALKRAAAAYPEGSETRASLGQESAQRMASLPADLREQVETYDDLRQSYEAERNEYEVRGRTFSVENYRRTLSGNDIPRVALPQTKDWGEQARWLSLENVPGAFPFTAGVFPYKRDGEDPTRMFAGEGTPERTNRRFHLLASAQPAKRLSTAFDSVTLYGRDPAARPDVLGKVGNSGVSVPTLDDAKRLYSGFNLSDPTTSVSMTINGPAPMVLALYFNTAIDQAVERRLRETGRWEEAEQKIAATLGDERPVYRAESLPEGHDGTGLGLLGISG